MKKFLLGIMFLASFSGYATTICNFNCVSLLDYDQGTDGAEIIKVHSVMYKTNTENKLEIIMNEADQYCKEKFGNSSKAGSQLAFQRGKLDERGLQAPNTASCIKL